MIIARDLYGKIKAAERKSSSGIRSERTIYNLGPRLPLEVVLQMPRSSDEWQKAGRGAIIVVWVMGVHCKENYDSGG